MAVKIRLQRRGRKKLPLYHIVIADSRSPRDGRFIENIGSYNPLTRPATIEIDRDKAFDWLMKGAQPTDTVRAILKFKGVMYRKHLNRGVVKGAMTQEEADVKYQAWIAEKESNIAKRVKATDDEVASFHAKRSGAAKPAKVIEETVEEAAPAEEAPVAENTADAPVPETVAEAPATETATEAPATETPAEATETAPEAVAEPSTESEAESTETPTTGE